MSKDILVKSFEEMTMKEKQKKPLTKRKNLFQFSKEKDIYLPLNFIWYALLDKYNEKYFFSIQENGKSMEIHYSQLKASVKNEKIIPEFYGKADGSGEDRPYYDVSTIIKLFKALRMAAISLLNEDWEL